MTVERRPQCRADRAQWLAPNSCARRTFSLSLPLARTLSVSFLLFSFYFLFLSCSFSHNTSTCNTQLEHTYVHNRKINILLLKVKESNITRAYGHRKQARHTYTEVERNFDTHLAQNN